MRRQIRDAVASKLAGLTTTGANVFITRTHPVEETKLPCLIVYTSNERAELTTPEGAGTKAYLRMLDLTVEGIAQGTTTDDTLDAIALEVEEALEADTTLGGVAWDITLTDTTTDVSNEGSREGGAIILTYEVTYHAAATDPSQLSGG